ncbi:MAG TPA: glycosyltransferase [Nakamurella multipartita]|nr:glycosyltransferase [Nakamurella multipartita]
MSQQPRIAGISIVCVYNDPEVLDECLSRSVAGYSGPLDIDYLPMDNTSHWYHSAGAALNAGARRARHETVVFVHQDVFIHSFDRLAEAGALLGDEWGMLGANGMDSRGGSVGRMRDRILLIGASAPAPVDVDTLDEVLFMVGRSRIIDSPLAEDPELSWHAYAVEYSVRLRRAGLRVGAVDLAITHNSMSTNMAKLDVAHAFVGESYADLRPIHTTCGAIGSKRSRVRQLPLIRSQGWRLNWLKRSVEALRVRRTIGERTIIGDISHDVDLLSFGTGSPLQVINFDDSGSFARLASGALTLTRNGRPVSMQAVDDISEIVDVLRTSPVDSRILLTDLTLRDLKLIGTELSGRRWIAGVQPGVIWLLSGPDLDRPPPQWSRPQVVPAGASIRWN